MKTVSKKPQEPVSSGLNGGFGRTRLLAAASELFADYGVNEVTIAQILELSEVKAPTLYHHFGGKEGLYVTWAVHTLNAVKSDVSSLQQSDESITDYLQNVGNCILNNKGIDLSQVMRDRKRLAFAESADQINLAIESAIIKPIETAIVSVAPHVNGRCAAQVFVHMITGARGRYRLAGLDKQPCVEHIVAVLLNGLLNPAKTPSLID